MQCPYKEAKYAIIGCLAEDGHIIEGGVLCWHDNQLDAYRDRKALQNKGYVCRVVPAPGGDLSKNDEDEMRSWLPF